MRVWVTGAGGLIGSYVGKRCPSVLKNADLVLLERRHLDLEDSDSIYRLCDAQPPDAVIHCAALANTAFCEKYPERALRVNVEATRALTRVASHVPLIFLSTDIVFDGLRGNYSEKDDPNPINVYGRTKLNAEKYVLENPKHTVLRLSLNGGSSPTGDRGFNEVLCRAFKRGESVKLYTDEFRQPMPAAVTADVIWEVLTNGWTGLFHLAGAETMSRFAIGELVGQRWQRFNPRLIPDSLRNHKDGVRAPNTSLNCRRLQERLSFPLPSLRAWLDERPNLVF